MKSIRMRARAVFINQPLLYGFCQVAEKSVCKKVLDILKHELIHRMTCLEIFGIFKYGKNE